MFPHSTRQGTSRLDHDHPTPYDPTGPPGQTSDHNDAPLARVVTGNDTTVVELIRDRNGHTIGEIYPTHHRIACDLRPA